MSENLRFSSKNDELLILIYKYREGESLENPILTIQKVVQEDSKENVVAEFTISNEVTDLLIFLIEQDGEIPIEQIDPVIRIHYEALIEAFGKRDYLSIEKYLGDDDLLGVKRIESLQKRKEHLLTFRGVHKLDRYHYAISLKKQ